jgi:hypothetical protein
LLSPALAGGATPSKGCCVKVEFGRCAVLALALTSGAASAETVAQPLVLTPYRAAVVGAPLTVKVGGGPIRPAVDLANPLDSLAPTSMLASPMESAVFARTAVDHGFSRRDDITGSVGFLCGLQPGHNEGGGAAAFGSDPHGRFVGAKLSLAFR